MKNGYPDDEEVERIMDIIKRLNFKNGEELTEIYLKSDVLLLACVFVKVSVCKSFFVKFVQVSVNEFRINPLYCVSLPGYTWQCGLK